MISALEHPSIRATASELEALGMAVTVVAPEPSGAIDAGRIGAALRPETRLVCLMLAKNEIGTLQPVAEVGARVPEGAASPSIATRCRRRARSASTSRRWASTH